MDAFFGANRIAVHTAKAKLRLGCALKAPSRRLTEWNEDEVDENEEGAQRIELFAVPLSQVLVVHARAKVAARRDHRHLLELVIECNLELQLGHGALNVSRIFLQMLKLVLLLSGVLEALSHALIIVGGARLRA